MKNLDHFPDIYGTDFKIVIDQAVGYKLRYAVYNMMPDPTESAIFAIFMAYQIRPEGLL